MNARLLLPGEVEPDEVNGIDEDGDEDAASDPESCIHARALYTLCNVGS